MKKKLIVGVLSAALLTVGATTVLGADGVDSAKLAEIKSLTQQMYGIQKQIVDKEVEAGLLTQEQADHLKESISQKQQRSEETLDNGKVLGLGLEKHRGVGMFKAGEPLTEDQIAEWLEQAQTRLQAQVETMKSSGKFTDEQITEWLAKAQARLDEQAGAMKNGTFAPGDRSFGKGMHDKNQM
ncbi:MAG TPA: DUF2680 domain-containing protein [Desulfitobacterium dehalogenans]|uniref:DUF2680 domain-containing protein n=1 Tax=Desulfitobacterium dehalogenans TaxID=36854 RepID=A0A7C6Z6X8_9FIRM|nr:DUF2680 domain-containing protein [Desulfitobacterium dehalogenans]